ncbi:MAG: class I SAM-dependent methyltransferase [Caldilineales bacterium]|nr:class I SAM-dependent methyltransferase [Caldilineales bacterium]
MHTTQPKIIDYEGSRYRTEFWENQGREYEDLAERAAIRQLLPEKGAVLIEVGAGFGRLADLYGGYDRVILMDYSLSLLQEAQRRWGDDDRFLFVAASAYTMPFVDALADSIVMIRVMHHLQRPSIALGEIGRVLRDENVFVLEYANKRNLKSIGRYVTRRQSWSPFGLEPYEFVELNYDFHPDWMTERIRGAGFLIEKELAVSAFRVGLLKQIVPATWLARFDKSISGVGAALKLAPSVFVRCRNTRQSARSGDLFLCPVCKGRSLSRVDDTMFCPDCQSEWAIVGGIYDFRQSVSRETGSV